MTILLNSLPYIIASNLFIILAIRMQLTANEPITRSANTWLSILFLVLAIMLLDEFLQLNTIELFTHHLWDKIVTALNLTIGPLTYSYIVTMSGRKKRPYSMLWHFLPAVFLLVGTLLMLPENIMISENNFAKSVFSLLFLATLLPYMTTAASEMRRYEKVVKTQYSNLYLHNLLWIKLWLGFMTLVALFVCLSPLATRWPQANWMIFDAHYPLILAAIVLLSIPDIEKQQAITAFAGGKALEKNIPPDPELIAAFNIIETHILKQRLFLNNGLTLPELAQHCQLPVTMVSNALNMIGKQCFYDYTNSHRIEESKRLLHQYPSRSVLSVAMESGFNSKSAFYNAFKKMVGCAPNEYRTQPR